MSLAGASTLQARHCAACTGPASTGKRTITILVFRGAAASDPTRRATVSTGINVSLVHYGPPTPQSTRVLSPSRRLEAQPRRPLAAADHANEPLHALLQALQCGCQVGHRKCGGLSVRHHMPLPPCHGSNKLNEGAAQIESDPLPHPSHCRQDKSFRSRALRRVTFLLSKPRPNPRRPTRQQHSSSPQSPLHYAHTCPVYAHTGTILVGRECTRPNPRASATSWGLRADGRSCWGSTQQG